MAYIGMARIVSAAARGILTVQWRVTRDRRPVTWRGGARSVSWHRSSNQQHRGISGVALASKAKINMAWRDRGIASWRKTS